MGIGQITLTHLNQQERRTVKKYGTWQKFIRGPRLDNDSLLASLDEFSNPILLAGCQRSGTTILTRIIAGSAGFSSLALTDDDELDAALALSGKIILPKETRYCFQTTYLNERYVEYRTVSPRQKLIWVLRNPESVVHSMLYNWKRFALNELYEACGVRRVRAARLHRVRMPWPLGPSALEKACWSYVAKTEQLLEIRNWFPDENLLVIDYDALVSASDRWLPRLFEFVGEPYDERYGEALSKSSLVKKDALSGGQKRVIADIARPAYDRCIEYVSVL